MNDILANRTTPITKVYVGADRACRCGCRGSYASVADGKIFSTRVKRFMSLLAKADAADVEDDGDNINISYGNNRAMTVYFD